MRSLFVLLLLASPLTSYAETETCSVLLGGKSLLVAEAIQNIDEIATSLKKSENADHFKFGNDQDVAIALQSKNGALYVPEMASAAYTRLRTLERNQLVEDKIVEIAQFNVSVLPGASILKSLALLPKEIFGSEWIFRLFYEDGLMMKTGDLRYVSLSSSSHLRTAMETAVLQFLDRQHFYTKEGRDLSTWMSACGSETRLVSRLRIGPMQKLERIYGYHRIRLDLILQKTSIANLKVQVFITRLEDARE